MPPLNTVTTVPSQMGRGKRQRRKTTEKPSATQSPLATKKPPSSASPKPVTFKVKKTVTWLLGLGFWVQGFRCFPWMGVNFFLKDELRVSPSALTILANSANLPMVGKPFYGVLSDAISIFGGHRLPYIAIGVLLQAISWVSIVVLSPSSITVKSLTVFLLLGNLGASITEVVNDAIVAEAGKYAQPSGHLQSFVWTFASAAGVLGNLLGGLAVSHTSPATMFLLFGVMLCFQLLMTISIRESSLGLPTKTTNISKSSSIRKQMTELCSALSIPEISWSIAWFFASFAVVPMLLGTMFYYQTEHLKLDSSVIGLSKVFGQAYVLVWSISYNKWLRNVPPKKLLSSLQAAVALLMVSDVLFLKGIYRQIGIPDFLYVMFISGLLEVLVVQFKVLPFSVHIAHLCPVGCEGSLMAFVMSATALASIVSGYMGVALASWVGATENDFSTLTLAIVVEAILAAVPICWSSLISDDWPADLAHLKIKKLNNQIV